MAPPASRQQRKPSVTGAYPRVEKPRSQRSVKYIVLAVFIFASFLFIASPGAEVVTDLRLFHHTPTHKPPVQKNSTSGDVHWFSDWKWLNPFSASITLDDDRSVLPPLKPRPPIYTFYDAEAEKEEKVIEAENKLLLVWRRAWWAQGFRPVVLGRSEAMNNPLYESFQVKKLPPQLEADLVRWLAWGQMGSGILANWLCLPMGPQDDALLSYFRRGSYPKLTRYEGLSSGIFSGEKAAINAAIQEALDSPNLHEPRTIVDAIKSETMEIDTSAPAVAFYDANAISVHYKPVSVELAKDKAKGLESLAHLITSHLHLSFLTHFSKGFAVLTPHASKARSLTSSAHALATALGRCPSTPIPSSCPPNNLVCTPCSSLSPLPISLPEYYNNSSAVYTIGTVPHPYTFASLLASTMQITTRHIRRDTERDRWLAAVTQKTLGKDIGGPSRIVTFKESVAGEGGVARGLWMIDDPAPSHKDFEYHFGFKISAFNVTNLESGKSLKTKDDLEGSKREKKAEEKALQRQMELIEAAKEVVRHKRKKKEKTGVKEMVEAWNLADTEAWHFVRAFGARERVEREKWEVEERRFAGGEEKGGGWKWFDRH